MSDELNSGGLYSGRLNRAKFTVFFFLNLFVYVALLYATLQLPSDSPLGNVLLFITLALYLLVLITIIVKRAHDINWSGAWFGFMLIPLVNIGFIITLMVTDGTVGPNKFGEDPLGRTADKEDGGKHSDAASYCPECKAQFREGFSTCSDCGIPLQRFSVGSMGQGDA